MKIPGSVLNKYMEEVKEVFEKNYAPCKENTGISFEEYLNNFTEEMTETFKTIDTVDVRLIGYKTNYIRKTKQNFIYKFIKSSFKDVDVSDKSDNKIDKATFAYMKLKDMPDLKVTKHLPKELALIHDGLLLDTMVDTFKSAFNISSFKDYILNEIDELLRWANDNLTYATEFKYITYYYSPQKIEQFLKRDIELFIYKKVHENADVKQDANIYAWPVDFVSNMPIDPTNRRTTSSREGDTFIYVERRNSEILKHIIDIPGIGKNVQLKKIKVFNLFDRAVIKAMIQLSGDNFFETRTVSCELGSIVGLIDKNRSTKTYNEVQMSILKISSILTRIQNLATGTFMDYDIFKATIEEKKSYDGDEESDVIENDNINSNTSPKKYQKLIVKAVFSEVFISKLLKNAIFVDTELENLYTNKMTQALILPLQMERYKRLNNNDNLHASLGYNSFFKVVLLLGDTNKSRNLTQVEKSLKQFVDTKKIITSCKRVNDYFYVEFKPLSEEEKSSVVEYLERMSIENTLKLPFLLEEDRTPLEM